MIKRGLTISVALAMVMLAGCDKDEKAEKPDASQVIAKVDDTEVTVHQLNHALGRVPGIKPEQAQMAREKLARNLVDQQVLFNAAVADKLDRDPAVLMDLEAAKREILAKAYITRHLSAAKPAEAEVKAYYEQHPDLFAQRKIYNLLSLRLTNAGDKLAEISRRAEAGASMAELQAYLGEQGLSTQVASEQKGAEHLPLEALPKLAALEPKRLLVLSAGNAAVVYEVVSSKSEPVSAEQAKPFIEAYIANRGRSKQAEQLLADLKQKAKISYQGDFAKLASAAGAAKQAAGDVVNKGVETLR